MKQFDTYISEKLVINKNIKSTSEKEENYASNWQWFNNLICNVELDEEQYRSMFANLTDAEVKVWIKEVQDCYVGSEQENDAMKIGDDVDLARFYYNNPVTE